MVLAAETFALQARRPFIHLRTDAGRIVVAGEPQRSFGHKIARPSGPPDGIFSEWHWDGRALTAATCRFGVRPIFYFERPGEICLSSSIVTLIERGAPTKLDRDAMAVFFRMGSFVGDDTPFEAIKILPPSARLCWNGALALTGGPTFARPVDLTRDQAIDAYIETFRQAVARRYADGSIVPLSGGRDSRHILFELCRIGRPHVCVTVQPRPPKRDPNDDVICARIVAQAVGVDHIVLDYDRDAIGAELKKNLLTNFGVLEHAWYMPVHARLAKERRVVFDGLGGDFLSAGAGFDPILLACLDKGDIGGLATRILQRRWGLKIAGVGNESEFPLERARERVAREVKRHLGAPNPIGSFQFWNRVRRGIALCPFGIMADHDVRAPFLDHDVFDLLAGLPAAILIDKKLHNDTLRRAFPQHSHLPFEMRRWESDFANRRDYYKRNLLGLFKIAARHPRGMPAAYVLPRLLAHGLRGAGDRVWFTTPLLYRIQLEEMIRRAR